MLWISQSGRLILPGLILIGIACADGADRQRKPPRKSSNASGPPSQVCSSDGKYCVRMKPTAGRPDECTLRVSAGAKIFANFSTMGYLLDAFFSPDNAYVAINTRRSNSGDYLWVISLRDGRPIKIPDDVAEDAGKKGLGEIAGAHWSDQSRPGVIALCPTCTSDDLRHAFLFSTGWTRSGEFKVVEELEFSTGWIAVNHLCRPRETGLSVTDEKVVKEDHPSDVVKRAWTWSPFHTE